MSNLLHLKMALAELKRRKQKENMSEEEYNFALRLLRDHYQETKKKDLDEEFQTSLEEAFSNFRIRFTS